MQYDTSFVLKNKLNSINIDLSKVFTDEYEEINRIKEKPGIDGVWEQVTVFIEKILNYMENAANKRCTQIVQETLHYIEENYTDNGISLGRIAKNIYLTPNYISMLIKQATGENFTDIVIRKRIEKAKNLLFDPTLKIYDISEKVGYHDPGYFSSLFKKVVGMSPVEFRNKFRS